MTQNPPAPDTHHGSGHGIGLSAVILGALTLLALVVMAIWIAASMAGGAGGFAIMSVMPIMGPIVAALGVIGAILGIAAIIRESPRRLGLVGLALSLAPVAVWGIMLGIAAAAG